MVVRTNDGAIPRIKPHTNKGDVSVLKHLLFIHGLLFVLCVNTVPVPFEDSLSEEQIDVFHKILDCVRETAADEMRAAYKIGFKDGAIMMQEIQD